jgi:hypothetical protein
MIPVRAVCRVSRDVTVDVELEAESVEELCGDEVLDAVFGSGELLDDDDVELEDWSVIE